MDRIREATGMGPLLTTETGKMALLKMGMENSHPLPEIM
jgi:hypothetical protein